MVCCKTFLDHRRRLHSSLLIWFRTGLCIFCKTSLSKVSNFNSSSCVVTHVLHAYCIHYYQWQIASTYTVSLFLALDSSLDELTQLSIVFMVKYDLFSVLILNWISIARVFCAYIYFDFWVLKLIHLLKWVDAHYFIPRILFYQWITLLIWL